MGKERVKTHKTMGYERHIRYRAVASKLSITRVASIL